MQDVIYRELQRGVKTVGALSAEYSVSKSRIEAIRKLKAVEEEMRRQVSSRSAILSFLAVLG